MPHRLLLTAYALAACLLLPGQTVADDGNDKPLNFVFIFADDINRDSLGVYGNPDCKTPNIDQLAKEGVRFDQAYCATAMCGPFRHELYSGRSPWRTGTMANHTRAWGDTIGIGHYLRPLGYIVSMTGKGHSKEPYAFDNIPKKGQNEIAREGDQRYTIATRMLIQHAKEEAKPFCLFIASHDGHAPHNAGDPTAYDADRLTIPPYYIDTAKMREVLVNYYAEVTNFDALVGQVRGVLEENGLADNTVIMVSTEQGSQFPFAKWTCYVNGQGTALIVHWPGVTEPGSVNNELVAIADVVPTLVDMAGGTLEAGTIDGKSFAPMLRGEKHVNHAYHFGAFSNLSIAQNRDRQFPIRSIRDQRYTLLYNANHERMTGNFSIMSALALIHGEEHREDKANPAYSWVRKHIDDPLAHPLIKKLHHRPEYEFYDREVDPNEITNLYGDPAYAEVQARLKKDLHAFLATQNDADPMVTERWYAEMGRTKPDTRPENE